MIIVSKSNEKIKYINSLKNKKFRDKYGKYILEGIKLVDEYISSEGVFTPEFIVVCKDIVIKNQGGYQIYEKVKSLKNLLEVDENVFEYLTDTLSSQGILIVIPKKEFNTNDLIKAINNNQKFIVLDKIQDPGNMGTIIRTCVSFGVENIICLKGTVEVYSSKVVRSTMGAINKIKIYYLDINELLDLKSKFKDKDYLFVSTNLKAKEYLDEIKPTKKMIYIMGNEANGVSEDLNNICDFNIKIKMEEVQESLNVSVASGIVLYDLYVRGIQTNKN